MDGLYGPIYIRFVHAQPKPSRAPLLSAQELILEIIDRAPFLKIWLVPYQATQLHVPRSTVPLRAPNCL